MSTHRPPKRPKSLLKHRQDIERGRQRKKRKRDRDKGKATDADSMEAECEDEAVRPRMAPSSVTLLEARRPVSRKRKRSNESNPKQRWSEADAVGHILADEVHVLLNPFKTLPNDEEPSLEQTIALSSGERRQLTTWVDAVQKQISIQSGIVLENVRLVSDLRHATTRVRSLRDDLMVLRTHTRCIQQEGDQLERELSLSQKHLSARRGASRFLSALENLATACGKRT